MACDGLHCAGCLGGMALPVLPLLEVYGVVWIAEHIIEVAIVCGTSGALAVAVVVWLIKRGERRDERHRAAGMLWNVRADVLPPRETRHAVSDSGRAALGFRDLHVHLDGVPTAEQAAVIRQAINGRH